MRGRSSIQLQVRGPTKHSVFLFWSWWELEGGFFTVCVCPYSYSYQGEERWSVGALPEDWKPGWLDCHISWKLMLTIYQSHICRTVWILNLGLTASYRLLISTSCDCDCVLVESKRKQYLQMRRVGVSYLCMNVAWISMPHEHPGVCK